MPNDIPVHQNQRQFIELLKASSRSYRNAKVLTNIQTWLAVSCAVAGPLIASIAPNYKIVGTIYALGALVVDAVFLDRFSKSYQGLGARIQEVFDTDLLQIPWNKVRVQRPDPSDIVGLASKTTDKKKLSRLFNWYPVECGKVPLEYARLICQRANMRWDYTLRERYAITLIVLLFVICVAAVVAGLVMQWNMLDFVMVIGVPLLPIIFKIWREAQKHDESVAASKRAKGILEAAWENLMEGTMTANESLHESRRLQDELYDRRKVSPTVPEFVFLFLRVSAHHGQSCGVR